MKTKKLAALLSAAAMAVTSMSVTAFAAAPVEVTDFAGLKTALAADPAPTEIIAKGQIVITESIDLKGATLKAASAEYISGSGNGMVVINGTDVTVSNGKIDGNDMDYTKNGGQGYYVVNVQSGAALDGVDVTSGVPSENNPDNLTTKSSIIAVNAALTLKDCNIATSGRSAAIKADNAAVTVNGGKIEGYYPIQAWQTVTLKGGAEVKAVGGTNAVQCLANTGDNVGKLIVQDATVDGNVQTYLYAGTNQPTIEAGEDATLKNFNVTVNSSDTEGKTEPAITIDENATVTLAATAVDNGSIKQAQLAAALKTVKNITDSEGTKVTVGDDGKVEDATQRTPTTVFEKAEGVAINWGATPAVQAESDKNLTIPTVAKGDKIKITFKSAVGDGAQIKIGVHAGKELSNGKWDVQSGDDVISVSKGSTDYTFTISDELMVEALNNMKDQGYIYVQGQNATVSKIEVLTAAAPAAKPETVKAEAKKPVVITPAETALDETKGNSIVLKSGDKIVELEAGNVIAVEYKDAKDFPYGAYFAVNNGGKSIAGWKVTQPLFTKAAGTVTYTVSAADITTLDDYKTNGLTMSGNKVTVTKITVYATKAEADEALKTETTPDNKPENNGSSNPGYVVITPNDTTAASDTASAETTADTAAATTANGSASEGDKNQATGVVLAVIPAVLTAAGVVASKKRK